MKTEMSLKKHHPTSILFKQAQKTQTEITQDTQDVSSPTTKQDVKDNDIFVYHIYYNSNGYFYADIKDPNGNVVFEICIKAGIDEGQNYIFKDKIMIDVNDTEGLKKYLVKLGIMEANQKLKKQ